MSLFDSIKSLFTKNESPSFEYSAYPNSKIKLHNKQQLKSLIEKYTSAEADEELVRICRFKPINVKHTYSDKELTERTKQLVFSKLYRVSSCKQWIRDSVKPQAFFGNYDELIQVLSELKEFEEYFPFYEPLPSADLTEYSDNLEKNINSFLDRWYISIINEASKLKTDKGRQGKIDRAKKEMELYSSYFSDDNLKYFNQLLSKDIDYEKVSNPPVKKDIPIFNKAEEQELLAKLKSAKNKYDRHFVYIEIQNFYYKYRDIEAYLNECINYCLKDIEALPQVSSEYAAQGIRQIKEYAVYRNGLSADDSKRIYELNKYGFDGDIPAFKRLCIIYEKQKQYDLAEKYCDKAIRYYTEHGVLSLADEFKKRKEKLVNKASK